MDLIALLTISESVFGFAVRGGLDHEYGNPSQQQEMDPAARVKDEEKKPDDHQT